MSSDAEENDFIHKMLLTNNIKVENGRLLLLGRPGILINANIFVGIIGKLLEYDSSALYDMGRVSVKEAALDYKKRFKDPSEIIALLKNIISSSGIGSLSVEFSKDKVIFDLYPSVIAESYLKLFGLSNKPVCFLSAGLFNEVLSIILDKGFVTTEVECIAKGNQKCKFVAEVKI
ncbi:4-vinyl reductase [Candidatus Parvarchaeota archaeon]|nr:4-vinyl reductase [Candidatus Parvarchaeota archaeon]